MPTTLKLAAIQQQSIYGDVGANLAKAESLITQSARAGARLVVLPELFNTGYAYSPANYKLAEPPGGKTQTWLKELACRLNIHLAGASLVRRGDEIFNTLLLVSPDGRAWEYDKRQPWGWERAYFRPGSRPVVAETALGKIGLLVCYDVAFPKVFAAYRGKIQLLVISSCPPMMNRVVINFPNGRRIPFEALNPINRLIQDGAEKVFSEVLRKQITWLGVPMVNAMPHGDFNSFAPCPRLSFAASVIPNPWLWPLIPNAANATLHCGYIEETVVVGMDGAVLARPNGGDSFALAEVEVPETPPRHSKPQPKMTLHPAARWVSSLLAWLMIPEYSRKKNLQQEK